MGDAARLVLPSFGAYTGGLDVEEEAITRLGSPEPTGPLIEKPFTVQGLLDKVQDMVAKERWHG